MTYNNNKPLSLYIHLPWCVKKCPYCDFNAHPVKGEIPKENYINHLIEDLNSHSELLHNRYIQSIFIGGGTPSLFTAQELSPLLSAIRAFPHDPDMEVTIEVNPGVIDLKQFSGYYAIGINRISIGGQSFCDDMLSNLGRVHSGIMTHWAIREAKSCGFERINLDIMYALPHQTLDQALYDLETFLSYELEHLSWYQLNIEPNTLFAAKQPILPKEHLITTIEELGTELLHTHSYQQYEISAWTKNKRSTHNTNYWHFGDYLGIGCGAHSKITHTHPFNIQRLIKHKHPKAYMTDTKIQLDQFVPESERLLELAIGYFRTRDKLSFTDFKEKTGLNEHYLKSALNQAFELKLVEYGDDYIQTTKKGWLNFNDICLSLSEQS
ncbi:radical SAM family heme chaperone HemW [Candidatus Comchoanobacter bicostacola]|uniref:Heme chaperone HemW n=1 Tax=Candidatus Comchoanobacter bicostacola TaxID=2919598 RepID=A0ABY5DKX7_9GAMM|nr:radical SAM family heme chaperone HemW [Candidatus Comchoanobacter bicostacola]UTC24899.1 radical SAM family heme chaperone HemW [Candidatus Comchoanobacter bicostacola]